MELRILAIFFTLTGAQQGQLVGPENTLSVVGSNVALRCVSPSRNCRQIEWQKYVPDANAMNVFRDRAGIYYAFRDRYSIDNSSGCQLVIKNVNLTDAGLFVCRVFISSQQTEKAASLIILKIHPSCTINASHNDVVEGDGVQLTCEVTYNATSRASMTWKGVENALPAVEIGQTVSRPYSFTASIPVVPSFTCATSFALDTAANGIATNIPVTMCMTPAINILYSVRNVTLSPSLINFPPGTIINCMANGHTSPTFKWQEMENDGTWMDIQVSSQFVLMNSSLKQYRCLATNVVRGRSYNSASHVFRINNLGFETNDPGDGAGIAMGVGIGFIAAVVLATVVLAILIKLGYIDVHPRPIINECFDGRQDMKSSSQQVKVAQPSNQNVVAQESAYAGLGEDRDVSEYKSLELRQKAKPKKASKL